jgi:GTP pyrophosphokinase
VHTEVGHRCRGAKVDGRMVPLTYRLKNGEQVEVLTAKQGRPSRDWLNSHQGYLVTSRAKSRVRAWFKRQDYELNVSAGRGILDRELHRLGVTGLSVEKLADHLGFKRVDDMLAALGSGDKTTAQLAHAVNDLVPQEEVLRPRRSRAAARRRTVSDGGFDIQGVGNLLSTAARCCKPVPNDPIIGYITRGRGVTIHRQDCGNILKLQGEDRARLIEVNWGEQTEEGYQVDIAVEAYDRSGLLRDITALLANEKINLTSVNTITDEHDEIAHMQLVTECDQCQEKVLSRNVADAVSCCRPVLLPQERFASALFSGLKIADDIRSCSYMRLSNG